jgi:hypothetical protein
MTFYPKFEVRNEEVEQKLREIGRMVKSAMPEGFGFTLMIFSYKGGYDERDRPLGSMFYMSSAERHTMIEAMREFIAKNEEN